jgi:hypothetical protein
VDGVAVFQVVAAGGGVAGVVGGVDLGEGTDLGAVADGDGGDVEQDTV